MMPKVIPLFDFFKAKSTDPEPTKASFPQPPEKSGLLVTIERNNAVEACRATVSRIVKECRANNEKFRDIEFDLEKDRYACLNALYCNPRESYTPSDICRVTQIFDKPEFYVDGATSNDIVQGELGDCWFLSALATVSTVKGLLDQVCVARDQEAGVYGFVFFKNDHWVHVVIDDLLYTAIPKFDQLNDYGKTLYHDDKEHYNKWARKGSPTLYFARSGTDGETWVPLIEKAYAKLYGDYPSLNGGFACEGVEDLTGGVSSCLHTKDILNREKFWEEELLNANEDRLFGCFFLREGDDPPNIMGLRPNHSYSVLRAREAKGKQFVVIRNPWGHSEWTGPWSDGSKEWDVDSVREILPLLEHKFGDDGQFVMEYSDFMECWDQLDRTLLFNSNWITSSQWLRVTTRPLPSAWTFGDVCFTVTIPMRSSTIIVLSQLDSRYFKDVEGLWYWSLNFLLFKSGQLEPLAMSSQPRFDSRSVKVELALDAGDYVVHVRLDRRERAIRREPYELRKLSRLLASKAQSQLIACNFKAESQAKNLAIPIESIGGLSFAEMQKKKVLEKAEAKKKEAEAMTATVSPVPTADPTTEVVGQPTETAPATRTDFPALSVDVAGAGEIQPVESVPVSPSSTGIPILDQPRPPQAPPPAPVSQDDQDANAVFLGLRVYTDKSGGPAIIGGQLRHEMEAAFV